MKMTYALEFKKQKEKTKINITLTAVTSSSFFYYSIFIHYRLNSKHKIIFKWKKLPLLISHITILSNFKVSQTDS